MFSKFKKASREPESKVSNVSLPIIVIVEDDPDQMLLLADFVLSEIRHLKDKASTNLAQQDWLKSVRVVKVSNARALKQVAMAHDTAVLVILDCNIPDKQGGKANDQFVADNHVITGQHKSVDLLVNHLPDAPLTLISSMNRFRSTVTNYYREKHGIDLAFLSKNDAMKIKKNIGYYLRRSIPQ